MTDAELLSPRQVSECLSISAEEVSRLVKEGKLNAYRIGGTYLRFKREQVIRFREEDIREHRLQRQVKFGFKDDDVSDIASQAAEVVAWPERAREFWYFNNFYIYSFALMAVLLYFIFR